MSMSQQPELPRILGFEIADDLSSPGIQLLQAILPAGFDFEDRVLRGNQLLSADGAPLSILQGFHCISDKSSTDRPSLLGLLKRLRDGEVADLDLSAFQTAYDLMRKAARRSSHATKKAVQTVAEQYDAQVREGYQDMDWRLTRRPDLMLLPQLRLSELQPHLQEVYQGSALQQTDDSSEAIDEAAFKADNQHTFQQALDSSQHSTARIFAIVVKKSSATGFYEQLHVTDQAELTRWVGQARPKWLEARLAYLGIILYTRAQQETVSELFRASKSPVEPLLMLAITLEIGQGREPMEMSISLVLRMKMTHGNDYSAANLEVVVDSSDSGKYAIRHVIEIIKAELASHGITVRAGHAMKLLSLTLQQADQETDRQSPKDLQDSQPLAAFLYAANMEAARAAFESEEMESRVWLAVIQVPVDAPPQTAGTPDSDTSTLQSCALQQLSPEAPGYRLPLVNANQTAVANELVLRLLLMKGLLTDASPDSYKQGVEKLRKQFHTGLEFIVFTPVYLTLRQQTLQRLKDAGLDNSGADPRVLSYKFSAETTKQFEAFKSEVEDPANQHKLFVMIVDEAHHAAVSRGAHDAFVNDLMWKIPGSRAAKRGPFPKAAMQAVPKIGKLCDQDNLVTLLVSATPACLLTADSRIPRQYYVPKEMASAAQSEGLQPYSIISTLDQGAIIQGGTAKLADMAWTYNNNGAQQQLGADVLQRLIQKKVVRELNVVDWHDAEVINVPYRSINDYISSTCKPRYDHHGIFSDNDFDLKLGAIRRARVFQSSISNDVALALDYVLSMQYFRVFRYAPGDRPYLIPIADSKRRLSGDDNVSDFLKGLFGPSSPFSTEEQQALYAMLRLPLQLAIDSDADQPWLQPVYSEAQLQCKLSGWGGYLTPSSAEGKWASSDLHILKAWLWARMESEERRCVVGHQTQERYRQFSETDRLIKSLVTSKVFTAAESCGPGCDASDPSQRAVEGPLIVIRVRASKASDSMGTKVVSVLKRYLAYTQHQHIKWQRHTGQYGWQLFEVIGDFGKNDQTEVMQKLSELAKHRPMSPDHPERNAPAFKDFWTQQKQPPSLLMFSQYKKMLDKARQQADSRPSSKSARKAASLQYSDLHGVPAILVLCEKGRMGDTFPQTFTCQDQRLRSGSKYVTWVQELGRLCRYPAVISSAGWGCLQSDKRHSSHRLGLLAAALAYAHNMEKIVGDDKIVEWESSASAAAAAQQQDVCRLIQELNRAAALKKPLRLSDKGHQNICNLADAVMSLQGNPVQLPPDLQLADIRPELQGELIADKLEDVAHKVKTWRQHILDGYDGTLQTLQQAEVFEGQSFTLPVRIMVDGIFRIDCLDSNDLVKLFCCCADSDALLQQDSVVTIARYAHHLPYALVDGKTHDKLQTVQQATQRKHEGEGGKGLGKPLSALSDNVLENWPAGSQVDKFMWYNKQLRGSAIHNYRDEAKSTNKHYDSGGKAQGTIHKNRLLLKAQPQQGKTGAYIGFLQHLRTILQPADIWQPRPGEAGALAGLTADPKWYAEQEAGSYRWQHPFFDDLLGTRWPAYKALKPGKYAHQVALRRTLLLASVAKSPKGTWIAAYKELVLGAQGEHVVAHKGRVAMDLMETELQPYLQSPPQVQQFADSLRLTVQRDVFVRAVNWDGRVEEAAKALAAADSSIQAVFEPDVRLEGSDETHMRILLSGHVKKQLEEYPRLRPDMPCLNVVQQNLWPAYNPALQSGSTSEEVTDICDEPGSWSANMPADGTSGVSLNGNVAHTMQIGRILRPVPAPSGFSSSKLVARTPRLELSSAKQKLLFPVPQHPSLLAAHGPVFLATTDVWEKLQLSSTCPVELHNKGFTVQQPVATPDCQPNHIHNWIFVPTYNRSQDSDPHQMRIDWADAISHTTRYVRILAVRADSKEVQDYSRLLLDHQLQVDSHLGSEQATLLMVMPSMMDLQSLELRALQPYQRQRHSQDSGIGYARLCIQLVAYLMGLGSVWMLDDNVSDCWELPFSKFVTTQGQEHGALEPIKFDRAMCSIEQQVLQGLSLNFSDGSNIEEALRHTGYAKRRGHAEASPRAPKMDDRKTKVIQLENFTGKFSNYAVIGMSMHIKEAYEVGFQHKRAPWGVSPSVYSMMLVNVDSTVRKGALYPAKPYHEDVDFAHLCEEKQLAMVKCNWLFFHKARVSPSYIQRIRKREAPPQTFGFVVLQPPAGASSVTELHIGQLIEVSMPASAGAPTSLSLGGEFYPLTGAAEQQGNSSQYVICLPVMPTTAQGHPLTLHCTSDGSATTLASDRNFRLLGLQTWQQHDPAEALVAATADMLATQRAVQLRLVLDYINVVVPGDKLQLVSSSDPEYMRLADFHPKGQLKRLVADRPSCPRLPLVWLQSQQQENYDAMTLEGQLELALPHVKGAYRSQLVMQSEYPQFLLVANIKLISPSEGTSELDQIKNAFRSSGWEVTDVLAAPGFACQADASVKKNHMLFVLGQLGQKPLASVVDLTVEGEACVAKPATSSAKATDTPSQKRSAAEQANVSAGKQLKRLRHAQPTSADAAVTAKSDAQQASKSVSLAPHQQTDEPGSSVAHSLGERKELVKPVASSDKTASGSAGSGGKLAPEKATRKVVAEYENPLDTPQLADQRKPVKGSAKSSLQPTEPGSQPSHKKAKPAQSADQPDSSAAETAAAQETAAAAHAATVVSAIPMQPLQAAVPEPQVEVATGTPAIKHEIPFTQAVEAALRSTPCSMTADEVLTWIRDCDVNETPAIKSHQDQLKKENKEAGDGIYTRKWKSKVSNAITKDISRTATGAGKHNFRSSGPRGGPTRYSIDSDQD